MDMMQLMHDQTEAYRRHADELVRYATIIAGPADAADIVADVFAEVIASQTWASVVNQRAYLYRAVFNRACGHHRSTDRRHRREATVAVVDRWAPPDPSVDAHRALGHLPPKQRAVVFFTYWADMDPQHIADLLDVSEGTVRKQLTRARATLRKVLDER